MARNRDSSLATLAAVVVFVGGFSTMTVFAVTCVCDPALRGFWSYRSATVGDAVLLPFLAFVLVRNARFHGRWTRPERASAAVAALVAAVTAAGVNARALLSASEPLNWTHPAQHAFNGAGWYHAAFMVTASAFFAAAFVAASLRGLRQMAVRESWAEFRLNTSAVGLVMVSFALLLARDNHDPRAANLGVSDAWLPACALLGWAMWRVMIARARRSEAAARARTDRLWVDGPGVALGSLGLALAASNLPTSVPIAVAAVLTSLCAAGIAYAACSDEAQDPPGRSDWRGRRGWPALLCALATGGPLLSLASLEPGDRRAWLALGVLACLGFVWQLGSARSWATANDKWPAQAFGKLAIVEIVFTWIYVWWTASESRTDGIAYSAVAAATGLGLFSTLGKRTLKRAYDFIVEHEQEPELQSRANSAKFRGYGALAILLFLGIQLAAWIVESSSLDRIAGDRVSVHESVARLWVAAAAIVAVCATLVVSRSPKAMRRLSVLGPLAVVAVVTVITPPRFGEQPLIAWVAGVWVGIGVTAFVMNGVWGHAVDRLSQSGTDGPRDWVALIATGLVGVACLAGVVLFPLWSGLPATLNASAVWSAFALLVVCVLVVPLATGVALLERVHESALRSELRLGVAQDAIVALLMAVLALVIPLVLVATRQPQAGIAAGFVIGTWGLLALTEGMRRNKAHLETQAALAPERRLPASRNLESLRLHMTSQNIIAGALLFPFVVVRLVGTLIRHDVKRSTLRKFVDEFNPRLDLTRQGS